MWFFILTIYLAAGTPPISITFSDPIFRTQEACEGFRAMLTESLQLTGGQSWSSVVCQQLDTPVIP